MTTLLHRKLALAAGLLCVAAPVLSSCGFDYATDHPNVISQGGYRQTGSGMRVLAARIVASDSNKGVFVATLALNPTADPVVASKRAPQLTSISTRSDSPYQVTAASFSPIAVTSTGAINMADPSIGGVPLTGDFKAGSIIPIVMKFSDGETVTLQTPVVTQCHEFASVAPQAGASHSQAGGKAGHKAAAQASATGTDSASAQPTDEASPEVSDSSSSQPSAEASAPYDCSFPSLPPIGE